MAENSDALIDAIDDNDLEKVVNHLAAGVDVNIPDSDGRIPLTYAVRYSTLEIVEKLLEAGANPNKPDSDGDVPLSDAIHNGNMEIVKKILEYPVDLDTVNNKGETLIHAAVYSDSPEILNYLLGTTLITKIDQEDSKGRTPLYCAAVEVYDYNNVKILVEHGAKVDKKIVRKIFKDLTKKLMPGSGLMGSEIANIEKVSTYLIELSKTKIYAPIENIMPNNSVPPNKNSVTRKVKAGVFSKLLGTLPKTTTNRNKIRNILITEKKTKNKTRKNFR